MVYALIKRPLCCVSSLDVNRVAIVIAILLIDSIVSGCSSTIAIDQHYQNPEFGISLVKPENWEIKYHERNRSIEIEKMGLLRDRSAYIAIRGIMVTNQPSSAEQELASSIDRIQTRYNLDSVTIIQEPVISKKQEHETGYVMISIPTHSIPKDSNANRIGTQSLGSFQQIELYVTICPENFAMVYLYSSNNEESNSEAEAIIDSIELVCASE